MRTEPRSPLKRYWPVAFLIVLGIGIGAWHNGQISRGRPDGIVGLIRSLLAPPARFLGGIGHVFSTQTGWIFAGRGVSAENTILARRVGELEAENARLNEMLNGYNRLRADLNFVQTIKRPPLAAEIWSRRPDPKYDTLIISRGSRDGIKPHDLVIRPEGVVGYISEVNPDSSTVVLLTDQNSTLGARIQRTGSRAVGLCRGSNNLLLSMTDMDNEADVRRGDLVVTSGLSRLYPKVLEGSPPRDLIIGQVVNVQKDPSTAGKMATVRPKVNFDRIEEVYVLR